MLSREKELRATGGNDTVLRTKTIRVEEETEARKALALIPLFSPAFSVLLLGMKSQHSGKKILLRSADTEESAQALASPVS